MVQKVDSCPSNLTKDWDRRHFCSVAGLTSALAGTATGLVSTKSEAIMENEEWVVRQAMIYFRTKKPFPYWQNCGKIGVSSGVYIGNGFVMTAAHVAPGPFVSPNGHVYPNIPNTTIPFFNKDSTQCDTILFRVQDMPIGVDDENASIRRFRSIPIAETTNDDLNRGEKLMLIGGGFGTTGRKGDDFPWSREYQIRGGFTRIEKIYTDDMSTNHYMTPGFSTQFFDQPLSCQACPGDSGGACFAYNEKHDRYELLGCIIAVDDGPHGKTSIGSGTYIANLAHLGWKMGLARQWKLGG